MFIIIFMTTRLTNHVALTTRDEIMNIRRRGLYTLHIEIMKLR